jgi:hypothetical protein
MAVDVARELRLLGVSIKIIHSPTLCLHNSPQRTSEHVGIL